MKLAVLLSGSDGNCIFVGSRKTRLLVDCGIRKIDLSDRLKRIGEKIETIQAIMLTHGHADHISGLLSVSKVIEPYLFMSAGTSTEIQWGNYTPLNTLLEPNFPVKIGDIQVESFPVPHDAAEPVGFVLEADGCKVGVVVDSGPITELMAEKLRDCQIVVLEANYDRRMLAAGGHSVALKRRIMGELGHLSNQAVAEWVELAMDPKVERLVLCHLSKDNNNPEVVKSVVGTAIKNRGLSTELHVVGPGCCSPAFYAGEIEQGKTVVHPPETAVSW